MRGLGGNGLFQPQGFNPGAASYAMPVPIPVDVAVAEDRGSPLPDPTRNPAEAGAVAPGIPGRQGLRAPR